jgi:REP element-mobilizing transposase RayT
MHPAPARQASRRDSARESNPIFEDEGAKRAFKTTLFEACVRSRWRLHAFAIMSNHYHLALETPEPNLTDGVRWLQSTFANRFNRFRRQSGHLFQGSFKSLIVENTERMSCLCHYLHLNPTRAGICPEPPRGQASRS